MGARYGQRNSSGAGMLKALLKPGWILTAVAVVGFTYVALTVLAPWQLGKNTVTSARNEQIAAAFEADPVPVETLLENGQVPEGKEYRRVLATGHYRPGDVLVRLRPVNSKPAYQILSAFELDSGALIMVNRGFVYPQQGSVPDIPAAPTTAVDIGGYLRRTEPLPEKPPVDMDGYTQVSGINTDQVGQALGVELAQDYVQLEADQPGGAQAIPLPQLESGPYLSYGIQWIAFGILAPIALGYFIYAEIRERRKEQAEREQIAGLPLKEPPARAAGAPEAAPQHRPENGPEPQPRPAADGKPERGQEHRIRYSDRRDHFSQLRDKNEERF